MTTILAMSCVAAATFVALWRPNVLAVRLRGLPRGAASSAAGPPLVVVGVTVGWLTLGTVGAVAGALVYPVVRFARARQARRAAEMAAQHDVAEACLTLAADLASGHSPRQSLSSVATEWPNLFLAASSRSETGGSIPAAFRDTAATPGAETLRAVAAAWEVSDRTGAPLADMLTAVSDSLRHEFSRRREAAAQLSTMRVTTHLMAILPVATLGLFSFGNDGAPVHFLTRTWPGVLCLATASVLVIVGLVWSERMARLAVRSDWRP